MEMFRYAQNGVFDMGTVILSCRICWAHIIFNLSRRLNTNAVNLEERIMRTNGAMGDPLAYTYFTREFNDVRTYEDFVYSTVNYKIMQAPIDEFIQFLFSEAGEEQASSFKQALLKSNYIQGMGEIWFISANSIGWRKSSWHAPFRDCSKNPSRHCI